MKKEFEVWLRTITKKRNGQNYEERTVQHYVSGIEALKKEFKIDFWALKDSKELLEKIFILESNEDFLRKDTIGNRMYSCALDRLVDFIYYKNNEGIDRKIVEIESDDTLSLEEKDGFIESLVNARNPQFQRHFKKELLREFNKKCALCDIDEERLLIASHIIRYRDCTNKSDMYRSYNGLLLCPVHNALFDKWLISFDKDGKIMINKSLNKGLFELFDISDDMKLNSKYIYDDRMECMKAHNKKFFEKDMN